MPLTPRCKTQQVTVRLPLDLIEAIADLGPYLHDLHPADLGSGRPAHTHREALVRGVGLLQAQRDRDPRWTGLADGSRTEAKNAQINSTRDKS